MPQRLKLAVLISAAVAVVILVLGYILMPSRFPHIVDPDPFPGALILSLDVPITDAQGMPYSGIVRYDPADDTYSYIAVSDEETITPLGPAAFTFGPYYLALRESASSTGLVIYDRAEFAVERVVANLPVGTAIPFVAWSPDGTRFAYATAGLSVEDLSLRVENAQAPAEARTLEPDFPIGFSPDGAKLLVRGSPMLGIVDIASGTRSLTTDTAFLDLQTTFLLSPSGQYLLAIFDTQIEWYAVDWEEGSIRRAGMIVPRKGVLDAAFLPDDTLLVREAGSRIAQIYAPQEGGTVRSVSVIELALPEGAHILKLVP